ncbi:unnamed protein product [Linum tenue]|uniref:Uncharacterized protein n=1 Tax=Linum tenue TaxID=586396 RepID=A0AAV0MY85_9ROSI|nr:unnamed protein product [Linum tenue]
MASSMENPQISSQRRDEMPEPSLRDYWGVRSQLSRDTIRSSRRFSGSHIRSFREEANNAKSFRSSQFTISSTASSPCYHPFKEEIDPSTYSFTTALKALQTRSGQCNSWAGECLSPDGFALHSKWNEAEKYICNPLSGQVPMECLSAKTLSGRSFYNKITVSAPLVYSSSSTHPRQIQVNKPAAVVVAASQDHHIHVTSPIPESKTESSGSTRDIGTQSTPPPEELGSSGSSPGQTAAVRERSSPLKRHEAEGGEDPPKATVLKAAEKPQMEKESTKTDGKKKEEVIWRCSSYSNSSSSQGGCLSWMRKRQREKHKTPSKKNIFLRKLEGC